MIDRLRIGVLSAALLLGLILPAPGDAEPARAVIARESAPSLPRPVRRAAPVPVDALPAAAAPRELRPFPHDLHAPGARATAMRPVRELIREGVLAAAQGAGPDTLRVAMFRVDFLQDSYADSSTGDGRFDLRRDVTGIPVDPPPHDKTYFEKHAEALARYYTAQSYGTLVIETTVLPADPEGAYHLTDTGKYGPWQVAQEVEVILNAEEFVTDAIMAVDASGEVDFSEFDAFVVVHAGADFQGDINRDSEGDIPSFTLTLGESLTVSTGQVGRVLVLPETVSQDGRLAALNGVFAHEFGHVMGLPDLYNIFNGVPQVGYWSLMDSGENIEAIIVDPDIPDTTTESGFGEFFVSGAFPTSFDPWCKLQIFPKGIAPLLVDEGWVGNLEAVEVNPNVPYVALDAYEYFLIENRALDLDGNEFPFVQQDSLTGVFLGPVDDPDNPDAGGNLEYDAVLPGGGVFIWHIDDKIVLPALADRGQVNLFTGFRGIAIEEADGIWDQGRFNLGRPEDAFFAGNNGRFGPETVPNSEANDGAWTGIEVEITSDPARFMGLSISRPLARAGWPFALPQTLEVSLSAEDLVVADLNGDGVPEPVYLIEGEEASRPAGTHGVGYVFEREDGSDAFGLFGRAANRLRPGLAAATDFVTAGGESPRALVAATEPAQGRIHLWGIDGEELSAARATVPARTAPVLLDRVSGADWILVGGVGGVFAQNAAADVVFRSEPEALTGLSPTSDLAVVPGNPWGDGPGVLAGAALAFEDGWVAVVPVGEAPSRATVTARLFDDIEHLVIGAVDPDAPQLPRIVAVSATEAGVIDFEGATIATWALPETEETLLAPALADIDGDGVTEIALAFADGLVAAYNGDGSPALGWPRRVPAPAYDLKILDVDGDGDLDVMVLDGDGRFHAWTGGGRALPEYPRALGPYPVRSAWVADLDGDGRLTWVGAADGGLLLAARLPGARAHPGDWLSRGDKEGGAFQAFVGQEDMLALRPELGPERLLVYPNPVVGEGAEIRFLLDEGETATLDLLDLTGREISDARLDLRNGFRVGENAVRWNTGDVAPGLYFCRLVRVKGGRETIDLAKVVVMR